jgi:RNA-binding protein YlmH
MKLTIIIDDDLKETRLDTIISNFSKDCSRSRAVRLVNTGEILVNHQQKKP